MQFNLNTLNRPFTFLIAYAALKNNVLSFRMDKNTFRTRYWINRGVCKNTVFYKILCYLTHFHQAIKVYETLINFKILKHLSSVI